MQGVRLIRILHSGEHGGQAYADADRVSRRGSACRPVSGWPCGGGAARSGAAAVPRGGSGSLRRKQPPSAGYGAVAGPLAHRARGRANSYRASPGIEQSTRHSCQYLEERTDVECDLRCSVWRTRQR